ncbi:MAG TPA: FAD-dependent oxidoreductase, partial [Solirubrobacteraceae bacterium]|nr:FAD-dependent oxidoreductase [Solirubrobacteraceae bacterium]
LIQRYPQGTLTKVAAVYDTPFWRSNGLTGAVLDTGGPVSASFDDSPPSGSPGVLFGFVGGDNARSYNAMSPSARQSAVINQFTTWFGSQAANPVAYFDTNWSAEVWTRGCPVGIRRWARCSPTAPRSGSRWAGSTGPGPRRRRTGTGTWTAPFARASALPPRP